jgi:hypothetical protein
MKVKAKIFLLAVVPFLIAIAGIGIGVRLQPTALAKAQHAAVESAYLSSKEMELRHYVEIATSAIAPFYDASGDPARDDATQRRKALAVLQKMDFGRDGYFFAYDMHGNSLMHPREPDLVGHNAFRNSVQGPVRSLPDALNTALFRIAQEGAHEHRAPLACRACDPRTSTLRACRYTVDRRQRLRLRHRTRARRCAPRHRPAQHARTPRRARRDAFHRIATLPHRGHSARAAAVRGQRTASRLAHNARNS